MRIYLISISIDDSLSKLFTLFIIQRGSLNVSFAFANALKSDQKLPPRTETLFHEPGKIPEQATYYAPTPTLLSKENPLLVQRLTYYRVSWLLKAVMRPIEATLQVMHL